MRSNRRSVNDLLAVPFLSLRVVAFAFGTIALGFFAQAQLKGDSLLSEVSFANGDGNGKDAWGVDAGDIADLGVLEVEGRGDLSKESACGELFGELADGLAGLSINGGTVADKHEGGITEIWICHRGNCRAGGSGGEGFLIKGGKVGGGDVAGIETGSPLLRGFLGKGIEHGFLHTAVGKGGWEAGGVEGGLDLLGERLGRGGAGRRHLH